jgi:hypothetical protein
MDKSGGKIFKGEIVPPDNIEIAIDRSKKIFPLSLQKKLLKVVWKECEYRDFLDLPDFNVIYPRNNEESLEVVDKIIQRIKRVTTFLNCSRDDLKSLTIYIDPVDQSYRKSVVAFYNLYNRELWVKAFNEGVFLDHELTHWVTFGLADISMKKRVLTLVYEGFTHWIAWQIKTEKEKKDSADEDYHHQTHKKKSVEKITLNSLYDDEEASIYGAQLFEILFKECNEDVEKLKSLWIKVTEIESKWKKSIATTNNQ